ncbi:hypothetical protein MIR68_011095 [Amoeboaphelidium protococcarum]|nr:hypothetical protein MIR68_011095 [Amoeboaphelidium protococcarum]
MGVQNSKDQEPYTFYPPNDRSGAPIDHYSVRMSQTLVDKLESRMQVPSSGDKGNSQQFQGGVASSESQQESQNASSQSSSSSSSVYKSTNGGEKMYSQQEVDQIVNAKLKSYRRNSEGVHSSDLMHKADRLIDQQEKLKAHTGGGDVKMQNKLQAAVDAREQVKECFAQHSGQVLHCADQVEQFTRLTNELYTPTSPSSSLMLQLQIL